MGRLLAREFSQSGHEVRLTTETPAAASKGTLREVCPDASFNFPIFRQPRPNTLLALVRWAGVVFHNNISLKAAWPLLFCRRPWVVSHHTWIARPTGGLGWQDKLKRSLLRFATNIAVSQAIASSLPGRATVIHNPYDNETFRVLDSQERGLELIFVGRLVSDKGADILLEALGSLRAEGIKPSLSIVGEGPELPSLKRQAERLELVPQLRFAGPRRGADLAQLLNQHRIVVVPSRWQEPFGLVALEGIACGCIVVASEGGGLKEALGPCGLTFPNGDHRALAAKLKQLLASPGEITRLRQGAAAHLQDHTPEIVAARYLELFPNIP